MSKIIIDFEMYGKTGVCSMEILHSRKANQYRVSEEKELGDPWD